jgi:hypothetical protein
MAEIRCKIEILAGGQFNVYDGEGNELKILTPKQAASLFKGKPIKNVEVTPLSTYIETNSGGMYINGVWIRIP